MMSSVKGRLLFACCLLALTMGLGGCGNTKQGQRQMTTQTTQPQKQAVVAKPSKTLAQTATTAAPIAAATVPPVVSDPVVTPALTVPVVAPVATPRQQAQQSLRDGKAHVAILLPLSGKNAALGQAMLNAAQMAVFDLAGDNFELMPRDTGATPESASLAAQDALASGAQLVIGPVFAADVSAVKPVIQSSSVNMLALSSDASLAESGVYVMGFSPSSLVDRTVAYARHRGLTRFAALTPSDAYGALVQQAFVKAVGRQKGTVVASETYAGAADIDRAVKSLLMRRDEIDGLFIPASGPALTQITNALTANGFNSARTRLLGTGLWDEPHVGRNTVLIGGWFAAAEPAAREGFMRGYNQTYGQTPPRLATLAYDATALAVVLAKRSSSYDRASLASPSGFAGLDGIFRLTAQGTTERGLAIHEIYMDDNRIVDPAPVSFAGVQ